jgi:hypothetical protein
MGEGCADAGEPLLPEARQIFETAVVGSGLEVLESLQAELFVQPHGKTPTDARFTSIVVSTPNPSCFRAAVVRSTAAS